MKIDVRGLMADMETEIAAYEAESAALEDRDYAENCGRVETLQNILERLRTLVRLARE